MQATSFFAFWSAHGGVGRTLAVWHCGHVLAARGLRVLLVDFDLASPGLTRLAGGEGDGLVELLAGPAGSLAGLTSPCAAVEGEGGPRVLRAGRLDAAYWDRLDAWVGDRSPDLAALRRQIELAELADVVLVDVGAGQTRAAERVARALGDRVLLFSGLSQQHVAGTAELLRRCRDAGLAARVVLGPLPPGEDELRAAREAAAHGAFAAAGHGSLAAARRISHHPRALLHEQPHAARERGPVYAAHVELADELLRDAGLEVGALLRAAEAALAADDGSRALALLRLVAVIDPGRTSLAGTHAWLRARAEPSPASDPLFAFLAAALPADAPAYPRFATMLHRAGNPRARDFYARHVIEAPGDADVLGNFAACLTDVCGEHDLAEQLYEQALAIAPDDADHLGNYANFLAQIRRDPGRADACYRRALAAAPDDAHHLGNYANLRVAAFADVAGAEALYRRALAAEPDEPNLLGNLARLLFAEGRADEARGPLARALAAEVEPALRCELCFYALAHAPGLLPDALAELRALLAGGARSPGWDLGANVERARRDGHPEPALLAALAREIAGEA